jgi:hypothetical protein
VNQATEAGSVSRAGLSRAFYALPKTALLAGTLPCPDIHVQAHQSPCVESEGAEEYRASGGVSKRNEIAKLA